MLFTALYVCSYLSLLVSAQLAVPQPPWTPPDASNGTRQTSPSIPNAQWSTLLGNLIYFYDAQRSGNLSSDNRVSWRNSSCTHDGQDVGLDLTGYYDAGDYIKATFPLSFTLMSICWGALEYGKGYDLANQTAYLDRMLRWGLDWLMKAHPSNQTLYVLVGDADTDNAYWGGDLNIPQPRQSFAINGSHPGTDAAAGASAAFSICSRLYSNASIGDKYSPSSQLANGSYASALLTHAQDLYTFAVNAPGGQKTYQTSVPAVEEAYGSTSFGDELTIAALLLSWASNSTSLYQEAARYYTSFGLSGEDTEFDWDTKSAGVPLLFVQLAQAGFGSDASLTYRTEIERYLDKIIDNRETTRGGLLWYDGVSDQASLSPAMNAAMLAVKYAPLASESKRQKYLDFADKQVQYALGNNPMHVPYVVGTNPNAPSNPHSAAASGGDDIGQLDTLPAQEAYVLYGAVVGGPDKKDQYFDIRSDWPQTEVALDYNAPFMTLVAHRVLNDSNDPFYTSLQDGAYDKVKPAGQPCDAAIKSGCKGKGMSRVARIVVYVVIAVVALVIGVLLAVWIWQLRRNKVV